ncbi:MAG: peptide chain release factor N(5)-glutamine methyltransferase [Lachnospiraceae bacterium]|nr:peptide chain release factor N(5)-glutamine methyltransferase [Lachnospiraceae bacterium]
MTIACALQDATKLLTDAGVEEAALDAALILGEVSGITRAQVLAHPETLLTDEQEQAMKALLLRRAQREPLAYLIGRQEFMGLSFAVSPGVLIPRQDTEMLAEEAMRHLHDGMRILDLCTGTGCVALSLLHYSNDTSAVVTDLSETAIERVKDNAAALCLTERITPVQADLWPGACGKFDLVTANPPYIATKIIDTLQPEVRDHEPREALDGGEDGLCFYRRIIAQAGEYLYSDGWLLVEIGYDQGEAVRGLFEDAGYKNIGILKDYGGNDRVVKGCYY